MGSVELTVTLKRWACRARVVISKRVRVRARGPAPRTESCTHAFAGTDRHKAGEEAARRCRGTGVAEVAHDHLRLESEHGIPMHARGPLSAASGRAPDADLRCGWSGRR